MPNNIALSEGIIVMRKIYIFLIAIVCLVVLLIITNQRKQSNETIFTCTTFFDYEKEDKWRAFCQGIDSILKYHSPDTLSRITSWVIVNEYSEKTKEDWASKIAHKYPFITFIQKQKDQKGQAASLNIILQEIRPYQYWIQWEEAWHTESEFLIRAFAIMDSTSITQLQMTQVKGVPNWSDLGDQYVHCNPQYCIIDPPSNLNELMSWDPHTLYDYPNWKGSWPRFSLCPSINRVSFYTFGKFNTDPMLWPVKFEWEFGRRWSQQGGVKAILPDGPIRQNKEHKSTYS